jgi:hypothetical protein
MPMMLITGDWAIARIWSTGAIPSNLHHSAEEHLFDLAEWRSASSGADTGISGRGIAHNMTSLSA